MENSIKKRLSLQNEIFKWLTEFSEKLQNRANAVTLEVHELLDQTDIVEQDMKNTLNSFRNLSYLGFTENRISEEDEMSGLMKEDTKKLDSVGIPAQSYEADILPRYREAVSLGLSSYRNHMQKTNRTSSADAVCKIGIAQGQLPHIIGSEEYIHDNSCGLTETEDLILERESLDFSNIAEPNGVRSDSGTLESDTMLHVDLFGGEQESFQKEGNEPLVSAALDFKAMLEAALLSPYKFYDEESSSLSNVVHGYIHDTEGLHAELDHAASTGLDTVAVATSQKATGIMDTVPPITAENLISIQDSGVQSNKICSTLISGSLFDTEEESPLSSIQENHEVLSTKDDILRHAVAETLIGVNEIEPILNLPLEAGDAIAKDIAPQSAFDTSLSLSDEDTVVEASELPSRSDGLVCHVTEEGKSAGACSVTLEAGEKVEGHSQPYDDLLRIFPKDSFDNKLSSGQMVEGGPSPLPLKEIFDDSDGDGDGKNLSYSVYLTSKETITITSQSHVASHTNATSLLNTSGNMIGDDEPHSSSGCHSGSSSMTFTERCLLPSESFMDFRMDNPVTNSMAIREEPTFSTIVSVSQEPESLFIPVTSNNLHDLGSCSNVCEKNSNDAFPEENSVAKESFSVTELPHQGSLGSNDVGDPSNAGI